MYVVHTSVGIMEQENRKVIADCYNVRGNPPVMWVRNLISKDIS